MTGFYIKSHAKIILINALALFAVYLITRNLINEYLLIELSVQVCVQMYVYVCTPVIIYDKICWGGWQNVVCSEQGYICTLHCLELSKDMIL